MKVCKRCGLEKPKTEFSPLVINKDGLSNLCDECTRASVSKAIEEQKRRSRLNQLNGNATKRVKKKDFLYSHRTPCVKCGEHRLYVIDFHHVDPKKKEFSISQIVGSTRSLDVIEAEIKKCVCLCRNCHSEFHHFYGQNPKRPVESLAEYLQVNGKHSYEIIEWLRGGVNR